MPMRRLSVMQAKRFGVFTISPDENLKATARKMQGHNVSALVVTDAEGYLAGVISRTDLVRACYNHPDWAQRAVREFMATEVVTVNLDDPLCPRDGIADQQPYPSRRRGGTRGGQAVPGRCSRRQTSSTIWRRTRRGRRDAGACFPLGAMAAGVQRLYRRHSFVRICSPA